MRCRRSRSASRSARIASPPHETRSSAAGDATGVRNADRRGEVGFVVGDGAAVVFNESQHLDSLALAGTATLTPAGLMLQPQGQRYFVVINAVAFHGSGEGLAEGIAHKLTFGDLP